MVDGTKKFALIFCSILFIKCSIGHVGQEKNAESVPKYLINLDLPPEERWNQVAHDYKHMSGYIMKFLKQYVPSYVLPIIEKVGDEIENYIAEPFASEIKGISRNLDIPIGYIVLWSLLYEITGGYKDSGRFCTSIVAQDKNGILWQGRNFDYGNDALQREVLRNVTIRVDYQKNGKTLFTGNTMAGYVGVVTAQRQNSYTMSIDERDQGAAWENALMALLLRAWPNTFLMRHVLENVPDYSTAVKMLSTEQTIADCYYILAGSQPGQGVVITRDRLKAVDTWTLQSKNNTWFLVETNYDHWLPPPKSDDRRTPAIRNMNALGQAKLNNITLLEVMTKRPTCNAETIFTVIMSPHDQDVFKTTLQNCS